MTELTDEQREAFEEYRLSHPEYFPENTPIDTQQRVWLAISQRERQARNERIMAEVNRTLDDEAIERMRLRQHAAINALSSRNPMNFFVEAYHKSHIGHEQILKAIVYAECLKSSQTSKGLQPAVTGKRGSGKSHGVRASVHLLPKEGLFRATLSPKALYYKNPTPKTTFYMDDAILPEDLVSVLKRKQTEFQEKTVQGIVLDKKYVEMEIDKRMVFITTSVSALGDEQLTDRALLINIRNEKEDDDAFYRFENQRRTEGRPEFPEDDDVWLCRDMLSHIRDREFRVFLPSLDFQYYHDRRLMGMVYDLVEASAIFNYINREHHEHEGIIIVTATVQDLTNALDFDMFRLSDKGNLGRLSKSERAFDNIVQERIGDAVNRIFTERELADLTNTSVPATRNYLYGRGNSASSLKEECGLCGLTNWYKPDLIKDGETTKIHIIVNKHKYDSIQQFAYIKPTNINNDICEPPEHDNTIQQPSNNENITTD